MQNVENRLFNSQKSMDPNRTLQELKYVNPLQNKHLKADPNRTLQELKYL